MQRSQKVYTAAGALAVFLCLVALVFFLMRSDPQEVTYSLPPERQAVLLEKLKTLPPVTGVQKEMVFGHASDGDFVRIKYDAPDFLFGEYSYELEQQGWTMHGFVSDAAQSEFAQDGWNIFLKGDKIPVLVLTRKEGR